MEDLKKKELKELECPGLSWRLNEEKKQVRRGP